jgi:hypothetical protein
VDIDLQKWGNCIMTQQRLIHSIIEHL